MKSKEHLILNDINDKQEKDITKKEIKNYFKNLINNQTNKLPKLILNELENINNRNILVYSSLNKSKYLKNYIKLNQINIFDLNICKHQINRIEEYFLKKINCKEIKINNKNFNKNENKKIKKFDKQKLEKINKNIEYYKKLKNKLKKSNIIQNEKKIENEKKIIEINLNKLRIKNEMNKNIKKNKLIKRIKELKENKIKRKEYLLERNKEFNKINSNKYLYVIKENKYNKLLKTEVEKYKKNRNIKFKNYLNKNNINYKKIKKISKTNDNNKNYTPIKIDKNKKIKEYDKLIKKCFKPKINLCKSSKTIKINEKNKNKVNIKSKKEIYNLGNSYIKIPNNLKKINKPIVNIKINNNNSFLKTKINFDISKNKLTTNTDNKTINFSSSILFNNEKKKNKSMKIIKLKPEKLIYNNNLDENLRYNLINKNLDKIDNKIEKLENNNKLFKSNDELKSKELYFDSIKSKLIILKHYIK